MSVQEDEPPEVEQLVDAALRLREVVRDQTRTNADKRRAVDALGRALLRLKESLR